MSARECSCEELEAVVERMRVALKKICDEAYNHISGYENESLNYVGKLAEQATTSPTLSSLLARREAEKAVVEAAKKDKAMRYGADHWKRCTDGNPLCTALARLDQLEKEKA